MLSKESALPTGLLEQLGGALSWKSIYSKSDVENSVNKIKGLSFCEHVVFVSSFLAFILRILH